MRLFQRFLSILTASAACAALACGGSSDVGTGVNTSGTIALGVTPPSISVRQGELTVIVATVNRTGGFTGPVTFSVSGAPTGMAVSIAASSTIGTSTSSAISLSVGLAVPAGTYTLSVRASGTGVSDATATVAVTVTGANAQYALTLIGTLPPIPAGGRDSVQVLIARVTPFAGAVTLSLQNAPAGVTATFNPQTTTAIESWMVVSVPATVTPSTYATVVRGTVSGQADANLNVPLQVTAGTGSGNVTVDLSGCTPYNILWVAAQDGAGAWTRLSGANNLYRFNVTSGKGGFAWVVDVLGWTQVHVQYGTQAELTAGTLAPCPNYASGPKIISGTVVGLTSSEFAAISYAGGLAQATPSSSSVSLVNVHDGVHDFFAYRWAFPDVPTDKLIVRRDQNIPNNGTFAQLNFGSSSAEAIAVQSATLTVNGAATSDEVVFSSAYLTGAACDVSLFKSWAPSVESGTTRTAPMGGVPAAQQRASDYHEIAISTSTSENLGVMMLGLQPTRYNAPIVERVARTFFHTMADRTVTLGALIPNTPIVTKLAAGGGVYKRLQAAFTIPSDYQTSATFEYGTSPQGAQSGHVTASLGWLGTSNPVMSMPDFSAVPGWTNSWLPPAAVNVQWGVTVTGSNITGTQCVENGLIRFARATGGIT